MDNRELRAAALVAVVRTGITLDALAALLECNHGLSPYCPAYRRWADLDLADDNRQAAGSSR